ncbi:multidrug efflux MFS transporter [Paraburkholderia sp. JPY454]|uniref:Multidrug efflux MFS transporter n=1 Tax=Paraburkholderia youngii TaxID=2782701 RepID=A0ABX2NX83_9BURK|nr:multidrug efflux MFS transporter [Paraburkholderia youngii]
MPRAARNECDGFVCTGDRYGLALPLIGVAHNVDELVALRLIAGLVGGDASARQPPDRADHHRIFFVTGARLTACGGLARRAHGRAGA